MKNWKTCTVAVVLVAWALSATGYAGWLVFNDPPETKVVAEVITAGEGMTTLEAYNTCRDRAVLMLNDSVERYLNLSEWQSGNRPQLAMEVNMGFDSLRNCEALLAATLINEETKRKLSPDF